MARDGESAQPRHANPALHSSQPSPHQVNYALTRITPRPYVRTVSATTTFPEEPDYVGGITLDGVQNLKSFAEAGGTILFSKDSVGVVIDHFNLGVENLLKDVSAEEFNCPGSIVKVEYATDHPSALGMPRAGIAFFSGAAMRDDFLGGYVFENPADAASPDAENTDALPRVVAKFPDESLLLSGWLIGEEKIRGKAAVIEVPVGSGRVVLFGFNVVNRGHTQSTFNLLLNSLYQ